MLHETFTIELPYEELGIKQQGSATITTYIKDVFPKDQDPFKRPLIVICPGGGYNHHSPREGRTEYWGVGDRRITHHRLHRFSQKCPGFLI